MKVFLVLFILFSDHPKEPFEQAAEKASPKECAEQIVKLMAQPTPKNVSAIQYSCVIKYGSDT